MDPDRARRLVDAALIGEAVETLSVAVFLTDESLNVLAVNQAACDLVGHAREDLLALKTSELSERPVAELLERAKQAHRTGPTFGKSTLRRADGTTVEVDFVALPATVAGGEGAFLSFVRPTGAAGGWTDYAEIAEPVSGGTAPKRVSRRGGAAPGGSGRAPRTRSHSTTR